MVVGPLGFSSYVSTSPWISFLQYPSAPLLVSPCLWALLRPFWIVFLLSCSPHFLSECQSLWYTWQKLFDLNQQWFICPEISDCAVLVMKGSSLIRVVNRRSRRVPVVTIVSQEAKCSYCVLFLPSAPQPGGASGCAPLLMVVAAGKWGLSVFHACHCPSKFRCSGKYVLLLRNLYLCAHLLLK